MGLLAMLMMTMIVREIFWEFLLEKSKLARDLEPV